MMWFAFIGGVIGVCGAVALVLAAARHARTASRPLAHPLAPVGGYPEVDGLTRPLLMVSGVGLAIISIVLTAYSLRHLDSNGAPPNLLGQPAISSDAHANGPTGPLELPRRASVAEVARD